MEDPLGVDRVVVKRTVTNTVLQVPLERPPRSARFGCALVVFVLLLSAATLAFLWFEIAIVGLLLSYPIEDWPQLAGQLITEDTRKFIILAIFSVIISALSLPLLAYVEADRFLLWLKK